jgi:hypothetical protein
MMINWRLIHLWFFGFLLQLPRIIATPSCSLTLSNSSLSHSDLNQANEDKQLPEPALKPCFQPTAVFEQQTPQQKPHQHRRLQVLPVLLPVLLPIPPPVPVPVPPPVPAPIPAPVPPPVPAPVPPQVPPPVPEPVPPPVAVPPPVLEPVPPPVPAPVPPPVPNPVPPPVLAPIPPPVPVPVPPPVATPAAPPVPPPVLAPVPSPVPPAVPPTISAPVPNPLPAPTSALTTAPTRPPALPPILSPIQSPTQSPTRLPSFRPSFTPTRQIAEIIDVAATYYLDLVSSSIFSNAIQSIVVESIINVTVPHPSSVELSHWSGVVDGIVEQLSLLAFYNYTVDAILHYKMVNFPQYRNLTDEQFQELVKNGIHFCVESGRFQTSLRSNAAAANVSSLAFVHANRVSTDSETASPTSSGSSSNGLSEDNIILIVILCSFAVAVIIGIACYYNSPHFFATTTENN